MFTGKMIFAQVLDFVPKYEFHKCVESYHGSYKVQSFSCWGQFICMAFAQLTYRESLRDIETCLQAMHNKLYHLGLRGNVSRSTLAYANETRDWRIYADLALGLIQWARRLYANEDFGVELENVTYALDSTTIDLCLSLFPWAQFRRTKGAVKIHTLLDLRGNIPSVVLMTPGKTHDVNILDQLPIETGAIYILDRGYMDFERLYRFHQASAFFITRAKNNLKFQRQVSQPVDKNTGVQCDQIGILKSFYARQDYPEKLRRIRYYDPEKRKRLVFLTNNFILPALTIAKLYHCRWQIELFFKWIKQHLRIKTFYGYSENAVKTQIWISIAVYVLVAIIKKQLKIELSLYTILQILSVTIFEKVSILQALATTNFKEQENLQSIQLSLFD